MSSLDLPAIGLVLMIVGLAAAQLVHLRVGFVLCGFGFVAIGANMFTANEGNVPIVSTHGLAGITMGLAGLYLVYLGLTGNGVEKRRLLDK